MDIQKRLNDKWIFVLDGEKKIRETKSKRLQTGTNAVLPEAEMTAGYADADVPEAREKKRNPCKHWYERWWRFCDRHFWRHWRDQDSDSWNHRITY